MNKNSTNVPFVNKQIKNSVMMKKLFESINILMIVKTDKKIN